MFISVDPGFRSGTAIASDITRGVISLTACIEIHWNDRMRYYDLIMANGLAIDAIIIEDFKLTKDPRKLKTQAGSRMPSSQIIAIVETAAYAAGVLDRVVFHEPKDKEGITIPDEHRSIVGLSDHNQDAYRHMRCYALRKRNAHLLQG